MSSTITPKLNLIFLQTQLDGYKLYSHLNDYLMMDIFKNRFFKYLNKELCRLNELESKMLKIAAFYGLTEIEGKSIMIKLLVFP